MHAFMQIFKTFYVCLIMTTHDTPYNTMNHQKVQHTSHLKEINVSNMQYMCQFQC